MEDEDLLDEDATIVPNTAQLETFCRNLLQRLGIAYGHAGAEAAGSQFLPNTNSSYAYNLCI